MQVLLPISPYFSQFWSKDGQKVFGISCDKEQVSILHVKTRDLGRDRPQTSPRLSTLANYSNNLRRQLTTDSATKGL